MSAANRGATRSPADYYPTPAWCVHRLLEAGVPGLGEPFKLDLTAWFDPCAGDGAIIRAVNSMRPHPTWMANEIRPECVNSLLDTGAVRVTRSDFLEDHVPWPKADVIITNPPYSLAVEFIEKSIFKIRANVIAMLLRLNFLASADRIELWKTIGIPDIFVLPNRPDFSGGGGDACEYAWFVWHPAMKSQIQILAPTPKAIRVAQKPPKLPKIPNVEDLIA